jgi:hypothetical protein
MANEKTTSVVPEDPAVALRDLSARIIVIRDSL